MEDRIGKDIQGRLQDLTGPHHVVTGVIIGGKGVDLASVGFNGAGDLPQASFFGALEDHVFDKMRDARNPGRFIDTAHPYPHLNRHHRGPMVFLHHGNQTIG